jgi:hypothetical protein
MIKIAETDFQLIKMGDRWGDGRDDKNHPEDPGVFTACSPIDLTLKLIEECFVLRPKKK